MHLFEHPDVGIHLAPNAEAAVKSMGEELPEDEQSPEFVHRIPDTASVTVENEDGATETKTAGEWAQEAHSKGFTGFLFGNYAVLEAPHVK
jgi:hypothetical protein